MSETKILKSSWDCPSFTVLVAKNPPSNIPIIESSRKIGNGKKVPYLVESPKVKLNRENRCFKKPCGITASLCFDIPSIQGVYY